MGGCVDRVTSGEGEEELCCVDRSGRFDQRNGSVRRDGRGRALSTSIVRQRNGKSRICKLILQYFEVYRTRVIKLAVLSFLCDVRSFAKTFAAASQRKNSALKVVNRSLPKNPYNK